MPHKWTRDRVDNGPLRDALEASGMTVSEVCYRLGWVRQDRQAETSQLKRRLGMMRQQNGRGGGALVMTTIRVDLAKQIAAALDVSFDELYAAAPLCEPCGQKCSACGEPLVWPAELCGFCEEELAAERERAA